MTIAMTRDVSAALADCALTHLPRRAIDPLLAERQHREYERCLEQAGCRVDRVRGDADSPDSVFIEDTAIVLDELAVLARPAIRARRAEIRAVRDRLARYRTLSSIEPPATLDGGDVLVVDRQIWVGCSTRSGEPAVSQLAALVEPYGYRVRATPVERCLHLKSAVTRVGPDTLLVQPDWVDPGLFAGLCCVRVHPEEPASANALWVGDHVIFPSAFPRTAERLADAGARVLEVDVSELAKAEAGVTCCSLVLAQHVPECSP